jgi:hypothetical protein
MSEDEKTCQIYKKSSYYLFGYLVRKHVVSSMVLATSKRNSEKEETLSHIWLSQC